MEMDLKDFASDTATTTSQAIALAATAVSCSALTVLSFPLLPRTLFLTFPGHSRREKEQYGVKVTAEVLFMEASETWTKDFETFRSGRSMKLLGYDTLDGRNWKNFSAAGDDIADWAKGVEASDSLSLKADAEAIVLRSQALIERIGTVLEETGVRDGENLTFEQCERLVKAGVVVELVLEPMWRLRDVMRWRNETDIIYDLARPFTFGQSSYFPHQWKLFLAAKYYIHCSRL